MPSFSQIIIAAVATVMATSATPIDTLAPRDVNVCWGPNSQGTDPYSGSAASYCNNVHYEDSFTASLAVIKTTGADVEVTAQTHQTFGPVHCCNSCKTADGCIGWQINANCDCIIWKTNVALIPNTAFGVYGGPFQNKSGTFHPSPLFVPSITL
ncbi:hypothetical protein ABW21_db0206806 [Orbilia brochopaga]|nr:hypothetical protein ABW21_db0206806 [Drechslerella brochopaga]